MVLVDDEAGIAITKQDVIRYFSVYGPGRNREAMATPPNIEMALERLYTTRALSARVLESPELLSEPTEWVAQQATERALMQEYIRLESAKALESADWESLAREHYLVNKESFVSEPEVRTRLLTIGFKSRSVFEGVEIAEALRNRAIAGEDFEALVRAHSEGSSAKDGGDLGYTKPGQLIPEFERALKEMQPGDLSDLVVSRYGVHLIQLIERQDPLQKPFSEVSGDIQQQLQAQQQASLREALILEQKRAAGSDEVFVDKAWIELLRDPATRGAAIKSVTAD